MTFYLFFLKWCCLTMNFFSFAVHLQLKTVLHMLIPAGRIKSSVYFEVSYLKLLLVPLKRCIHYFLFDTKDFEKAFYLLQIFFLSKKPKVFQ